MKPWQKGNYIPPKEEEEEQDNSAATVEVITAVVEPEPEPKPEPVPSGFICPNCGKEFPSEKSLKVHMSRWCKPAQ